MKFNTNSNKSKMVKIIKDKKIVSMGELMTRMNMAYSTMWQYREAILAENPDICMERLVLSNGGRPTLVFYVRNAIAQGNPLSTYIHIG
jgi:hypothetical protein